MSKCSLLCAWRSASSTASGSWSGNKSFTGVQAFTATSSATYTLTCTNDQEGIVTRSVTIELEDGCEECLAGLGNREAERLSQTTDTSVSLAATDPFTSTVSFPVSPLVIPPHPPLKTGNEPPASQPLVHPSAIQRVTYAVAGQTIATHVTGDPVSGNNGFFYLYTDHLGSTTLLRKRGTSAILSGSTAYYLPFGSYRPTSTTPTQTITDKGFTGQKENMEVGLMYYNARFYAPGLGRFISADTIVPNPANPQSYNRYSYTLNNPLKYTDPSGHCIFIPPYDTAVCIVILALALTGDSDQSQPTQPNYPVNNTDVPCSSSLPDCFGDTVYLKDFSAHGPGHPIYQSDYSPYVGDNPIPIDEFEEFADRVARDLYFHDLTWPGFAAGRGEYDTPFYNNGQSSRRTDEPTELWPADQQVCIETIGCSGCSEINYIAQGMWAAATGEPLPVSQAIVAGWKGWEYQDLP